MSVLNHPARCLTLRDGAETLLGVILVAYAGLAGVRLPPRAMCGHYRLEARKALTTRTGDLIHLADFGALPRLEGILLPPEIHFTQAISALSPACRHAALSYTTEIALSAGGAENRFADLERANRSNYIDNYERQIRETDFCPSSFPNLSGERALRHG